MRARESALVVLNVGLIAATAALLAFGRFQSIGANEASGPLPVADASATAWPQPRPRENVSPALGPLTLDLASRVSDLESRVALIADGSGDDDQAGELNGSGRLGASTGVDEHEWSRLASEVFANEDLDHQWRAGAEGALRELFHPGDGLLAASVECRSTMCTIEADVSDPGSRETWVRRFGRGRPWRAGAVAYVSDPDATHVTFYFAREGHELP